MAHTPPGRTREKVFRYVQARLLEGSPPTVREVQEALGFAAVESARKQLQALVEEGRLVKLAGRARGYRLREPNAGPEAPPPVTWVPLLGEVQAGGFETAVEDPDGHVVMEERRPGDELVALRVRGDSMRDAGILPGDTVLVDRGRTPRSGDVVVAWVAGPTGEGEATVKNLRRRGGKIELVPANPDYPVLTPDPRDLTILGVVVELRRQL